MIVFSVELGFTTYLTDRIFRREPRDDGLARVVQRYTVNFETNLYCLQAHSLLNT